jgi:hypothetical protein
MKSQVNIKKGRLTEMTSEEIGKAFSFQIIIDDLVGKSDDANLILAAPDENQFSQWKNDISICFTIGTDARRRKSSLFSGDVASPSSTNAATPPPEPITPVPKPPTLAATPSFTSPEPPAAAEPPTPEPEPVKLEGGNLKNRLNDLLQAKLGGSPMPSPKAKRTASTKEMPVAESAAPVPSDELHSGNGKPPLPLPTNNNNNHVEEAPRPTSLQRTPSKDKKAPPFETIEVIVTSDSEDSVTKKPRAVKREKSMEKEREITLTQEASDMVKNSNPIEDPEHDAKLDHLAQTLEKMGKRPSFKPPKKLSNLLNSKGLTKEKEEEIRKSKEQAEEKKIDTDDDTSLTGMTSAEPVVVEEEVKPKPRQLVISVRPTSPVREGYLYKLDTTLNEPGEDAWISQFVSLEISTGMLQFYAELGG